MSRDFFNKAAENTVQLEKQIMPQPYKYYKFIKTPKEMGMSTKGGMKDLQDNVAALVSYGEVLISGKGAATDAEVPLGNKYFWGFISVKSLAINPLFSFENIGNMILWLYIELFDKQM